LATALLGAQPAEGSRWITIDDAQVKLISQARVPAREAGVLEAVNVTEGQRVKVGHALAVIDDRLARLEEELAKLEHEAAKIERENDVDKRYAQKSLEVAHSELKRSQQANQQYPVSVSQTEIERLQLLVERSALSIEQSDRDKDIAIITEKIKDRTVEATGLRVQHRQIQAPIDGTVVEVLAQQGEWLSPGEPVVRIIKLDRLRVEGHLDGRKFGRELEGCAVRLQVTLPPGDRVDEFLGKIVFVSPEVQPVTGEVRVWAEVENPELRLRPGDHGVLTIFLPAKPPETASVQVQTD
jgi:macrolide-specific efflux system membrane fusion protein